MPGLIDPTKLVIAEEIHHLADGTEHTSRDCPGDGCPIMEAWRVQRDAANLARRQREDSWATMPLSQAVAPRKRTWVLTRDMGEYADRGTSVLAVGDKPEPLMRRAERDAAELRDKLQLELAFTLHEGPEDAYHEADVPDERGQESLAYYIQLTDVLA
jgi:hypothetical protein